MPAPSSPRARTAATCLLTMLLTGACGPEPRGAGANRPTDGRDASSHDAAGDGATDAPTDAPTDTAREDDGAADAADAADAAGGDAGEGPDEPGPADPEVACLTSAECPARGGAPAVCCTEASRYTSQCAAEEVCGPGRRDACLADEQCAARRPGSWSVCCHDPLGRNYCAPAVETCQPLTPCDAPADCAGAPAGPCCSSHEYYRRRFCTSEFFARDAERDCP